MFDIKYITQYLRLYRYFLSNYISSSTNINLLKIYKKYYGNSYYCYKTDKKYKYIDLKNNFLADYIFNNISSIQNDYITKELQNDKINYTSQFPVKELQFDNFKCISLFGLKELYLDKCTPQLSLYGNIIPEELKDNYDVVLKSVICDGNNLKYASEELKNNYNIVLAAVNNDGESIKYASEELRNNYAIVLIAAKKYIFNLKYVS